MKSRGTWWLSFGACALGLTVMLVWITMVVLRLEQAQVLARSEAQHQQSVRLALWRMDSWLGPRLVLEATRPYFEYMPFYPQERAYAQLMSGVAPDAGDAYSPSPLLNYHSQEFPLHFQLSTNGVVGSPQVPDEQWRELGHNSVLSNETLQQKRQLLIKVRQLVGSTELGACVAQAEHSFAKLFEHIDETALKPQSIAHQQSNLQEAQSNKGEYAKADLQQRAFNANFAQQEMLLQEQAVRTVSTESQTVEVGPLVPFWLTQEGEIELLFVRRVRIHSGVLYQGLLGDWPQLRAALLKQVEGMFPHAQLVPSVKTISEENNAVALLASVPVELKADCAALTSQPLLTPARTTLGITWLAVGLAVAAAAITLRASISYGEKRSRFAWAVTHELRTPLTTFRMYSEMLAENMIQDSQQRHEYLQTLKSESVRLATLVENVLSYAQLEDGRAVSHASQTTVAALIQRLTGVLSRRANDAQMQLCMKNECPSDQVLYIDVEVVGQILFNLVDNACKYAGGDAKTINRTIQLTVECMQSELCFTVRDHGPGIAPEHAKIIFKPFERGSHKPGDTIPGVGLGLALARGLARDLGGELTVESRAFGGGANFRLNLPFVQS